MQVQAVAARLRAEGHKLTPQRLAIIEALAASCTHPTAYEIYDQVRQRFPMLGLATVYKTLDVLKGLGEVVETGFGASGARYEANLHPHVNLVCRRCGRVVDVNALAGHDGEPGGIPLDWVKAAAAQAGFTVQGGHIEYFGVCAECAQTAVDRAS